MWLYIFVLSSVVSVKVSMILGQLMKDVGNIVEGLDRYVT
jgi:hypothetical protein